MELIELAQVVLLGCIAVVVQVFDEGYGVAETVLAAEYVVGVAVAVEDVVAVERLVVEGLAVEIVAAGGVDVVEADPVLWIVVADVADEWALVAEGA